MSIVSDITLQYERSKYFIVEPLSSSRINIKLISVANTANIQSPKPNYIDIQFEMNLNLSLNNLIRNIRDQISTLAIKFHIAQSL